MTQEHPITPSPELVQEWTIAALGAKDWLGGYNLGLIAIQAARWGADQELKACRLWVSENCDIYSAVELIQFRRPKPPSLKAQALRVLDDCTNCLDGVHENVLRRALEALDD